MWAMPVSAGSSLRPAGSPIHRHIVRRVGAAQQLVDAVVRDLPDFQRRQQCSRRKYSGFSFAVGRQRDFELVVAQLEVHQLPLVVLGEVFQQQPHHGV